MEPRFCTKEQFKVVGSSLYSKESYLVNLASNYTKKFLMVLYDFGEDSNFCLEFGHGGCTQIHAAKFAYQIHIQ